MEDYLKTTFKYFVIACLLFLNSLQESCYETELLSACIWKCKMLDLPVDFERESKRCCCKLNEDVSKQYTVIQGRYFLSNGQKLSYSRKFSLSHFKIITSNASNFEIIFSETTSLHLVHLPKVGCFWFNY